jgi:NADPH2:quinone reductase
MLTKNRVKPVVYDRVYTLENLIAGLGELEQRKTWGKAIVRIRDADAAAGGKAKL